MRVMYPKYGLKYISKLFGLTRQSVYEHNTRHTLTLLKNEQVLKQVRAIRTVHPRIGGRKLHELIKEDLQKQNIKMGRDKLFSLLADNQLLIKNKKRRAVTTNSYHHFKRYPNIIKDLIPYKPNQIWVSDITYVKFKGTFSYLFLITDAYSHKVVGYQLGTSLETENAVRALHKAIGQCNTKEGVIHHSDRGIQYCSHDYVRLLQDNGMKISMTEDGNPLDNSIAERINGILKMEYIEPLLLEKQTDLGYVIDQAVHRYNSFRPHLSCNMMTPNLAHKGSGPLDKRWKNYYKLNQEIIN